MVDIIFCLIIGIIVGIFTGLAPGIHVNTVALFVLANYSSIGLSAFDLSIFIVSLTITHSIIDFIPSIFLGIPSNDVLSILPGHKLAAEGRGIEAMKITSMGSIIGCTLLLLLLPIILITVPLLYRLIKPAIPMILISIILIMLIREGKSYWKALIIVALAGLFGTVALKQGEAVLYAAFTGMFGISTLLLSMVQKTRFPEQRDSRMSISREEIVKSSSLSFISSTLLAIVPAIGSSQAATLSQLFSRKPEPFLLSLGVINSCVGIVSIISLVLIGKARSGAGVVIEKLMGGITTYDIITFVIVAFITSVISGVIAISMIRRSVWIFERLNYRTMSAAVIIILVMLGFYLDGIRGLMNLLIATLIGCLTIYFGVNRSHGMAFLMIPTLIYYLKFI